MESATHCIGPIIVGATGGSGTRVVAEVLMASGIHMGHDLNGANDSRSTQQFLRAWAKRYIAADYGAHFSADETRVMEQDLTEATKIQRQELRSSHAGWGWKNPPNIYLADAYLRLLPGSRFVHLVRDGRDMAFSENSGQLKKFGDIALSNEERRFAVWQQKLILWARANLRAEAIGKTAGAGRYLCLRFEDLTDEDPSALAALLKFIGLPKQDLTAERSLIHRPESIGRWRQHADEIAGLNDKEIDQALQTFGYR